MGEEALQNSPSFIQKLLRADHHIEELEAVVAAWYEDGYSKVKESDGQGRLSVSVQSLRPIPEAIPLLIGDALQNMRNALEHLAFAIALKGGMTQAEEKRTSFPILESEPLRNGLPTPLKVVGWPVEAVTAVESMQPYNDAGALDDCPLWLLNALANLDKHRRLTVASTAGVPVYAADRSNGVITDVDVIVEIVFGQGELAAGREVVRTLQGLRKYVDDVVIGGLRGFA